MATYTGLVIDDGASIGYEKVLVYIPEKDGTYFFGENKTVGHELLNSIGATEINLLRLTCKNWCYVVSEVNSGSVVAWDETRGISLMNNAYQNVEKDSIDLRGATKEQIKYYNPVNRKNPGDNQTIKLSCSPDAALHRGLSLSCGFLSKDGISLNENTNNPRGKFTRLTVGTKVIVSFPNDSSQGYITGQISPATARSNVLRNTMYY